jgi:tetratricopeptide (TPR) repeat protein
MRLVRAAVVLLGLAGTLSAADLNTAINHFNRTDYRAALGELAAIDPKDAAVYAWIGQSQYQLGEYKKATEALEKAVQLEPSNSRYNHWLGRAWGRRAETSSPLTAPGYAGKTRQYFERAVALDSDNREALTDLFDYYLQAPGFLGGGLDKAAQAAERLATIDAATGNWAKAQIYDRRKEFVKAEEHLRRAVQLAPQQVSRIIDLAKYLSKQGRSRESDAVLAQALKMAPDNPQVVFARAEQLVREKRNPSEAKALLERYLKSTLTPDDPPRELAQQLLRQVGS